MTHQEYPLLNLEALSVQIGTGRGTVRAVERASLAVAPGKTVALVGESGSGKSMLCRAIMGILPAGARMESGRLLFNGLDLGTLPTRELNRIRGRKIGMVLQTPLSSLNPVLTVGKQLMEPMRYHLGLTEKDARARALELLQAVGIQDPEGRLSCHPHQLSGGMRQRVAIAIALSCDPKLLIADEPTTAMDVTIQAEILNLLQRLQQERQMAMILVSHDLGVVAGRAHDTAVMYAGRIVEQAPTGKLFSRMRVPYTRALFDAIPRIDDPPRTVLKAISGQPPDLTTPLTGCPFAPRCDRSRELCRQEEPPLITDVSGEDHRYACWFPLDPEERS